VPPELRQRFERLLLELPEWEREGERRALLGVLREHEIWDGLDLAGSAATVAVRLLDLHDKHGPEPFLALLASLRDGQRSHPERYHEIGVIESALRESRARRRREAWNGPLYRGLAYFDRRHAPIFFGREAEVDALIRTMTATGQSGRFTVVVGASGSGKSSLVRAGLWARLAAGQIPEIPGGERWLVAAMRPLEMGGAAASLHAALVRALQEHDGFEDKLDAAAGVSQGSLAELAERLLPPGNPRWLLILDQMEELFAPEQREEGATFLDRLIEAARPPSRFQVLATLRADFFHHCLDHPPLKRAVARDGGTFLLSAPGRLALERMVAGPIAEVELPARWTLDAALPPTIAADAERSPGGLALMAFALRELYDRCEPNRRLDLAAYRGEDFGGLSGAIARSADATLEQLGEGAGALERVFARLVRVNQDDASTRRRERRSAWDDDPEARKLVDAFLKARLLVADRGATAGEDPVIEVAHEALLREWPRLAGWIDQRREAFRLAERVRTEAHAWMKGDPSRHHRRPWAADVIEDVRGNLAQAGLLDHLRNDPAVARLLTPEVDWILAELQVETTTHIRRRDIGQRLAEIGDPREGVGVIDGVPDILWRPIPGGEVEIEGHARFAVEPFHVAAFPVTFGQFRAFLEAADGYRDERWWKDLAREPQNSDGQIPLANHPVTDVSWFEATAFCRWLTARLGFEVRLPDEQEWQWAAQSARVGFAYPWGEDWREGLANTRESGINRTTAVGMYPQGDSLQKVSDLAGNVWEWCRTPIRFPSTSGNKYGNPALNDPVVLRGGSWFNGQDIARVDYRGDYRPSDRYINIGFRMVCSAPIR
jgi:hypothetical protein